MKDLFHRIWRYKNPLLLVVIILLITFLMSQFSLVKLSMTTDSRGNFRIYFPIIDGVYSEGDTANVGIFKFRDEYIFIAQRIEKKQLLRIDPNDRVSHLEIHQLTFYQFPFSKIDILSDRRFDQDLVNKMQHSNQVDWLGVTPTTLSLNTTDIDGQLFVSIDPDKDSERTFLFLPVLLGILLIGYGFKWLGNYRLDVYGIIPYLMLIALFCIMMMAILSMPQVHPDENTHVKSAKYYSEHWLPPEICDPDTKYTYSPYGVSRLNSMEAFYFVAGKYYSLARFLPTPTFFHYRSFNVLLFGILTLLAFYRPHFRIYCIPLLLSPQIWYIFGYFNSDAFALFISYLVIYQILQPDSMLNTYLHGRKRNLVSVVTGLITGGVVLGMIPFIKKNYYAFATFLLCFGIIMLFVRRHDITRTELLRWGAVLLIALSVVGTRYGIDFAVNGIDRGVKLEQCRELLARYQFNPTTPQEEQWFGLNMRKRGVTLSEVFDKYGWGELSFASSFGVFGPVSIFPTPMSIFIFKTLLYIMAALVLFCCFRGGGPAWAHTLNLLLWGSFLIFASLWNSWNVDLQSQGRYFFPIIAMVAMLLHVVKDQMPKLPLSMMTVFTFIISIHSFIFVGLALIPKI